MPENSPAELAWQHAGQGGCEVGAAESQAWSWRDAEDEGSQEEPGAGGLHPTGSGPEINEQRGPWSPGSSRVGAKVKQAEG